ncbi:methyl-accepting chemotaxis protein [Andreprevotia lacus DSM 23236]|jgi:methyl-accepting chemotaxis protein|uniref:Methyl-accepting chemotaxis protein n=1 Tax=Andreprevotia lacus DSM 23236 TaxID=1121001 RepID=A0A1W1X8K7_9NEIS|nr:methyl-accepting chemotaxis protein [Andreprevotia lacus]SMC20203.1 methyl-accepting chemotaxis protein [Andreprevotia lacus DSM 23236]
MSDLLFAPAARLSARLPFRRKFQLLLLVAIVPIALLLWNNVSYLLASIQHDKMAQRGAVYLETLVPLTSGLATHRGLAARALGGDAAVADKLGKVETALDQQLGLIDAAAVPVDGKPWQGELDAIRSDWQTLRSQWHGMKPPQSFAAHSALVARVAELRHRIAGDTGLLLETDPDAYFVNVAVVDSLPQVHEALAQMRGTVGGMAAAGSADERRLGQLAVLDNGPLAQALRRMDSNLAQARQHDGIAALVQEWQTLHTGIDALRSQLVAPLLGSGQLSQSADGYFSAFTGRLEALDQFGQHSRSQLQAAMQQRLNASVRTAVLETGVALGFTLLALWLIAGFARDVSQRASQVRRGMQALANGDFAARINAGGGDELGQVAQSADQLANELSSIIRDIRSGAHDLKQASDSISQASAEVAEFTHAQSSSASAMAAAVEQFTVSINHMAAHALDAHALSGEAGRASTEGGNTIDQTVAGIRDMAQAMRSAANAVGALGERAGEISGIAGVIKEIAGQTNLLALNAAIEAARAGESGRGFAVVADEVRKLAERTTQATQQIDATIGHIQIGTNQAIDGMELGMARVDQGVSLANQAGDAIAQIRDGSGRVLSVVTDISDGLKEQSAVATTVAGQVEHIAQMSENNSRAAESCAATAEQVRALAVALENKVAVFQVA